MKLSGMTIEELWKAYDSALDDDNVPMSRVEAIYQALLEADPQIPDLKAERIVWNCVADLAMEGMICTKEDVERMRRVASGENTADEEIEQIIARYRE